ncbi:MAG: flagellar protein FlaG [Candidatus Accumulibacter sp.]|jgi:flagellar protein FlaG|nr:flagellar protein FlaG [Accumulibacter sp.]
MNINEIVSHAATASLPPRQAPVNPAANPNRQAVPGTAWPGEVAASSQTVQAQAVAVTDPSAGNGAGFEEELDEATEKIQEFVNTVASEIKFSIDEDSGRTVVKVIDRSTQEVIRQIPSQEVLDLAQALDKLQGLLIRQKA